MQKIVDELLHAEAEAQAIVQKAREEVQRQKSRTEAECAEQIAKAREESRLIIQQDIEAAREKSRQEIQDTIDRTESENQKLRDSRQEQIKSLTDDVINSIIVPEYEKE